jgi:hypothetical protein
MRAWRSRVTLLMLASTILQTFAVAPSSADHFFGRLWRLEEEKWYDGKEPANMCSDDAIQELAMNIDWLEHHIDTYGSIVAKQPDIWGEARLTKHRDEYERMMYQQLNQFKYTINAAIRQSDSSFLAQAFALSAAVDGNPSNRGTTGTHVTVDNATAAATDTKVTASTVSAPGITASTDNIKLPQDQFITLEPTVYLDQMSRYLQHLHELRRINEGDDTSDSPGYALNLVRIPVSALPGKLTREGWGAEVTVTATPVLSADLMPTTFRNLVINDLVDVMGLPVLRLAERFPEFAASQAAVKKLQQDLDNAKRALTEKAQADENSPGFSAAMGIATTDVQTAEVKLSAAEAGAKAAAESIVKPAVPLASTGRSRKAVNPLPSSQLADVLGVDQLGQLAKFFCANYQGANVRWSGDPRCKLPDDKDVKEWRVNLLDVQGWLGAELAAAHEMLGQPNHLMLFYAISSPSSGLAQAIRSEHFKSNGPGNPNVEGLRHAFFTELHSHRTTSEGSFDSGVPCFDNVAAPTISGKAAVAETVTEALAWAIVVESALLNQRLNEDARKTAEAKHAYSIPVSDRDLCFFLPEAAGQPNSPLLEEFSAATQLFQEYVRVRWPIHVFAIDPREQDQNIADASARRRELQFALALGFVSGEVSANSLTNFSRELQTEIETISLNRTAVGFAHGHDTFGWRFYPRVQALDVPGTGGAIWQSIHGASRDHDMRKRQLEPGMRECVAIVLMPSFVPYADFDLRTNWFRLTNPKNAALTMKDTMKLSRAVTAMRNSQAQCARCAHCYRDGEVERLLKRVEQLDRELPLQTMRAQIPYENTLGGFEMFNTGVTDLAPELVGWYGAPGIVTTGWDPTELYKCGCFEACQLGASGTPENVSARLTAVENTLKGTAQAPIFQTPLPICQGQGTTVFLVGDHLSVHDTKIIAGGVCIPDVQLVSRQIARVTIPSCVNTVNVDGKDYVAVYAATPYGITNHLHIPIHARTLTKPTQDAITKAVADAVKKEVAALKLAPRDILLSAGDKKLEIEATCNTSGPAPALNFAIKPGTSLPRVAYSVENVAGLVNQNPQVRADFSAAVLKAGVFQGALIPVASGVELTSAQGSLLDNLDANGQQIVLASVLTQVAKSVGLADLADGKEAVKLVFFVNLTCGGACGVSTRLVEELTIEVTLPTACCPAAKASADAAGAAMTPEAASSATELLPTLETAPAEPVAPTTSTAPGCNCPQAAVENPFRR